MEWEYCIVIATYAGVLHSIDFELASGKLIEKLKELGKDEWELVDTVRFEDKNNAQRIQYNFKRLITPSV